VDAVTVRIPLRLPGLPAAVAAPAQRSPVTLPIGIGGSFGGTTSTVGAREGQTLRAVAAAASLADVKRALEVAKEARDKPGDSIGNVDANSLLPVLNAVVRVREDRSRGSASTDHQKAVAQAIGADPELVAAAFPQVESNANATGSSLYWVASLDVELLDRAAKAAAREKLFDLIPDQQTRLERLERRVDDLDSRVTNMENRPAPSSGP
jgi:hypothetical protein